LLISHRKKIGKTWLSGKSLNYVDLTNLENLGDLFVNVNQPNFGKYFCTIFPNLLNLVSFLLKLSMLPVNQGFTTSKEKKKKIFAVTMYKPFYVPVK
jgi:hypothetical protein